MWMLRKYYKHRYYATKYELQNCAHTETPEQAKRGESEIVDLKSQNLN